MQGISELKKKIHGIQKHMGTWEKKSNLFQTAHVDVAFFASGEFSTISYNTLWYVCALHICLQYGAESLFYIIAEKQTIYIYTHMHMDIYIHAYL